MNDAIDAIGVFWLIVNPHRQLEEALSWRLVTELWQRSPDRWVLMETHPGGGQYDCLTLTKVEDGLQPVLNVNRGGGSVHVHDGRSPKSWPDWVNHMLANARGFLDEIGDAIGIEPPKVPPKSCPTTISFRYVCEFLTTSVGRLERWECRNGHYDTSGYGGGKQEQWFSCFPGIGLTPPPKVIGRGQLEAAHSYWFLLKNAEPVLCLDTDGRLYTLDSGVYDLVTLYTKHHRVWPVIAETAMELLP